MQSNSPRPDVEDDFDGSSEDRRGFLRIAAGIGGAITIAALLGIRTIPDYTEHKKRLGAIATLLSPPMAIDTKILREGNCVYGIVRNGDKVIGSLHIEEDGSFLYFQDPNADGIKAPNERTKAIFSDAEAAAAFINGEGKKFQSENEAKEEE